MRSLLFLLFPAALVGCGGDDAPDLCDRHEAASRWSAVDGSSYEARAIRGSIALPDGRALHDDRVANHIEPDSGSIGYLALEANDAYGTVAVVFIVAPEREGRFTLEEVQGELVYCVREGATMDSFNGNVSECTMGGRFAAQRDVWLRGTLDVRPKPDVGIDEGIDYAYAFHLVGNAEDGSSVDLEVVAFRSYHISSGARCGGGQ